MKQSFLLNFSLSEWVKRLWTAKNQGIKNSKQEHFFPVPPTGSELFSTGGRQETSVCVFSFSYMSGCLFSEPRTLSCPQISPGSIAWLHLPKRDKRWGKKNNKQKWNWGFCKSGRVPLRLKGRFYTLHTPPLLHILTLFIFPRYRSPSLHRANTSSPSLTLPILGTEERVGLLQNSIYRLETLLPLLTGRFMSAAFQIDGFQDTLPLPLPHTHTHLPL